VLRSFLFAQRQKCLKRKSELNHENLTRAVCASSTAAGLQGKNCGSFWASLCETQTYDKHIQYPFVNVTMKNLLHHGKNEAIWWSLFNEVSVNISVAFGVLQSTAQNRTARINWTDLLFNVGSEKQGWSFQLNVFAGDKAMFLFVMFARFSLQITLWLVHVMRSTFSLPPTSLLSEWSYE